MSTPFGFPFANPADRPERKRHTTEIARDLEKLGHTDPVIKEAASELYRLAAMIAEIKSAFR